MLHPGRSVELALGAGRVFSVLALHGPCGGVDVDGARWPLHDAALAAGTSHGISNVALGAPHHVHVSVRTGVLTVVVPPEAAL